MTTKDAIETDSHFRRLYEEAPLPYQSLDAEGRVLEVNRAWEQTFGFRREEVLGKFIGEFQVPGQEEKLRQGFVDFLRRDSVTAIEFEFNCKDGTRKVMSVNGRIARDDQGHFLRTHCILSDITERKRMELALGMAKEAAEKANRAKSRFLSAVNHDLRQPLHALKLLINTLSLCRLNHRADEVVEDMQEAMQSMEALLNTLLDINKLEGGSIVPEKQNFHAVTLLKKLQRQFKATAREAGKVIQVFPSDAVLYTDPILLARILQNFISNAIRHTRSDRVVVGCRRAGSFRRIEVWDSGAGVPDEQRERIFEDYYQIENDANGSADRLGLGLAVAKRMADLLDLRIAVRSVAGKGSVFSVEVPLGHRPGEVQAESAAIAAPLGRHEGNILVVDDDEAVLNATLTLLNAYGYDAVGASTPEDALNIVKEPGNDIDVVLLDYRLSNGSNGIQLIQAIRIAVGWELPAILATGDTSISRLHEVRMSGLPLLHKPFDPNHLRLLLEQSVRDTA